MKTFLANLKHAVRNKETVTIGGGEFTPKELEPVVNALESFPPQQVRRMWVNQPSTLQPNHDLHGTRVLAAHEYDDTMRIWFLSGPMVSQQILRSALSEGWPDE